MKLSVAIIAKNEESCIATCLESVKDADEIIVVDTGSSDKTMEIALKYTDKVFNDYMWADNFAEARNHVLAKCTGDWILSIDCDEYIEPTGIAKLRAAIADAESHKFKTVNCKCIATRGGGMHVSPRCFRRCHEIFWCGAVHNYINITEDNICDVKIYFGYSEAHKKDPDRALRILKREVDKNPKLIREVFYLAREYWYRRDKSNPKNMDDNPNMKESIRLYQDYLTRAWCGPEIADAHYMLALCYWHSWQGDKARDECLQAIKINTNFKKALLLMSDMSGPINKKRWREFAETANNSGVLFS